MENLSAETYAGDINDNFTICGGYEHSVTIKDYINDRIILKIDELDNSVAYCKFINDRVAIFVLVNGTVGVINNYSNGEESELILDKSVNDSISESRVIGDYIVLGTESGRVIIYDLDLILLFDIPITSDPILAIDFFNDHIIAVTEYSLIEYLANGSFVSNRKIDQGISVKYIDGSHNIYCLLTKNRIEVYKGQSLLYSYASQGTLFSIDIKNHLIYFCGDFGYIGVMNTKSRYSLAKIQIDDCLCLDIQAINNNYLVFKSHSSTLGTLIFDQGQWNKKYFDTSNENIFYFACFNSSEGGSNILVCGDKSSLVFNNFTEELICLY